jgi:OPA family glycerol-3-phosphate transporter-like MFS transporter
MPAWLSELIWIVVLLVVVGLVMARLPKIELGHSPAFMVRRRWNWLPLGLTYAFLYMGRYNLTVAKSAFENLPAIGGGSMMGNNAFGLIFGVGTVVYGFSFILNGPLTDRLGGRFSILAGAMGAAVANIAMGLVTWSLLKNGPGSVWLAAHFITVFAVLYAINMYFQSFGAVAIVKVNAPWFHVRERGVFGAVFGVLISLGVFFAYDGGRAIVSRAETYWVFFTPAILLGIMAVLCLAFVRDTPGEAGFGDFDVGDASSGDDGPPLGVAAVFKKMLTNPVILTISAIEFCSGFLRQAIMQWYIIFAKQTGIMETFVPSTWGLLLCCAGIMGGAFAGVISDHLFQSRRGPVAAVLYGGLLGGALVMIFVYPTSIVGWLVVVLSMAVIGVHGMLSGTASMDFGGARNAGVAVGLIDGFVYLGTATMSFTYARILPREQLDEAGRIVGPATDPGNWLAWPLAMVPLAAIGFLLSLRVWNAKPKPGAGGH